MISKNSLWMTVKAEIRRRASGTTIRKVVRKSTNLIDETVMICHLFTTSIAGFMRNFPRQTRGLLRTSLQNITDRTWYRNNKLNIGTRVSSSKFYINTVRAGNISKCYYFIDEWVISVSCIRQFKLLVIINIFKKTLARATLVSLIRSRFAQVSLSKILLVS